MRSSNRIQDDASNGGRHGTIFPNLERLEGQGWKLSTVQDPGYALPAILAAFVSREGFDQIGKDVQPCIRDARPVDSRGRSKFSNGPCEDMDIRGVIDGTRGGEQLLQGMVLLI
jgi:hypothetical protein